MLEHVLSGERRWCVEHGDALAVLKTLPDCSLDSCVTDPPYFLTNDSGSGFMGRSWDSLSPVAVIVGALFRSTVLVLNMDEDGAAVASANTTSQSHKRTHNAPHAERSSIGVHLKTNHDTVSRSAAQLVITRDEALALCHELFPDLTDCLRGLRSLPSDASFVASISSLDSASTSTAQLLAYMLRQAPEWQAELTTSTYTERVPNTNAVTVDRSGISSENKSSFAITGDAGAAENIVEDETSNVTTSSRTELRKIIERIISSRYARAVIQSFMSAQGVIGVISEWWHERWALEIVRVLKPGAHALVFGGTRTFHRVASALENAGMELRDTIAWCHGQGFPKSLNLGDGKGTALKPAMEPIVMARKSLSGTVADNFERYGTGALNIDACRVAHASPADLAAHEEQVAAIKERGGSMDGSWKNSSDLSGANEVNQAGRWPPNFLLSHHPDCKRIGTQSVPANPTWDTPNRLTQPSTFTGSEVSKVRHGREGQASAERRYTESGSTDFAALPGARRDATETVEQWDCVEGCSVRELGDQSGNLTSGTGAVKRSTGAGYEPAVFGGESRPEGTEMLSYRDSGTAARFFPQFQDELDDIVPFFYEAKPSSRERDAGLGDFTPMSGGQATGRKDDSAGTQSPRAGAGRRGGRRNRHPTVKSSDLMRWLVRLVTPKGGVCLDCFAGSGSTGVACMLEGVRFIGIELNDSEEEPFVRIARARIAHAIGIDPHAPRVLSEDPATGLKQLNLFALVAKKS